VSGRTSVVIATSVLALRGVDRGELVLDAGLTYDGIEPVRVRVVKRGNRYSFDDQGGAVAAAGASPPAGFPRRLGLGHGREVNVGGRGVVSLPGFERNSDAWLLELPELVAQGSLALYEVLLDLDE